MDTKKIRKSTMGLMGIVLSLLLVLGIFTAFFTYWQTNAIDAGRTIDSKYNGTYGNLSVAQDDLDANVDAIKNNLDDVSEATSTYQVAWNGLKGLGNTLKLPINFVSTALTTYGAFDNSLDFIPDWIKTLILIGLTAGAVFIVLAVLRGKL